MGTVGRVRRGVGTEVGLECCPILEETGKASQVSEWVGRAQVSCGCGHTEVVQQVNELAVR
jgi:hypothetical protein